MFMWMTRVVSALFPKPSIATERRKLKVLLFLGAAAGTLLGSSALAAPVLVQHASKDAGTTASSSLAFPLNNTAGNWIAVVVRAGHSGQTFTVSDSLGNVYQQAVVFNQTLDTPNGDTLGIFYAENTAGGANTVTVSDSIANTTLRFAIVEYSGVATASSLDGAAGVAQGNGNVANSGVVSTSANGDLILGAVITGSGVTYTASSGFTIEERVPAAPNTKLIIEDEVQTASGSISAGATFSASASWGAAVVAFKAVPGAPPPGPNITSINPTSGAVGTSVTINGNNFGNPQGTSSVTFNGVSAGTASAWSNTAITVTVPANATSGNVVVTVNGQTSNTVNFTVTPPVPTITSIIPTSGPVGTPVTINGNNFGSPQGTSSATFNGVSAGTASAWSNAGITVTVPANATSGNVVVTVNGQASNAVNFSVTSGNATIALVQHASKDAGTTSSAILAFTSSNSVGNFIVVAIRAGHSGQNFSISDSQGNIYQQAVRSDVTVDTPNGDTLGIFYAEDIAGGPNSVTVSDSISGNTLRFAILEYSGVAPFQSMDGVAAAQGTGSAANSGSVNTTAPGDLLFGSVLSGNGATFTAGSGYALRDAVPAAPNSKLMTEDRVQASAGAASASATLSASNNWGAGLAAFKAASTGGGSPIISSLNPNSGAVGSTIAILGANFGAAQGASKVTFNGTDAGVASSWSGTRISVNVPPGATSGNVIVTVNGVASNAAAFTVVVPVISVTLTPVRGGVTITQPLSLTAAVQNDSSNAGVTWGSSGGSLTNQTSTNATFSAAAAGVYTITATSNADATKSTTAVIGVTDLARLATWRYDVSRSGVNSQEYALTPQNVTTSSFGKLFSCAVDGYMFAEPLWVANLSVGGAQHNVIFVATENDSLYALDADNPACSSVWPVGKVSLIPSGETTAAPVDLWNDGGLGPTVGITGTPVIDPASQTIYLVALTKNSTTNAIIQRLHAIDITTGQERTGSPVLVAASVNGSGYDNSGGTITFTPKMQKQRASLLLLNGIVYVCWAAYNDVDPYHGWMISYDAATLNQLTIFNDTPDGGRGGIWMAGGGPAADSSGNVYLLTGNGDFNANNTGGRNYGDSFLKMGTTGGLSVSDWFAPFDQASLATTDLDLGGGGAVLLVDQPTGPVTHLVVGGGKAGTLYVVNRDNMGHFNSSNNSQIVQSFNIGVNGIFSTPLFWQNTLYGAAVGARLSAFPFTTTTGQFQTSASSVSSTVYGAPGASPALSATGTNNGILWTIERSASGNPAVLHAYDPTNLQNEFWNSSQAANNRDKAGLVVKFTVPTVANGKVYVGTQTELDVFGLLPH
jgi:IPT/TIG domain